MMGNHMRTQHCRCQPFSLIEMLVVMMIIIVIAGMTVAAAVFVQNRALTARTRTMLQMIETAMEQYNAEYGVYPQQTAADDDRDVNWDLALKVQTLEDMKKPSGAMYLDWRGSGFGAVDAGPPDGTARVARACQDAFAKAIFYECPGKVNSTRFDLWSAGPDEKFGNNKEDTPRYSRIAPSATSTTNDDITNWKRAL